MPGALSVHLEPWGPDDHPLVEQLMGDPAMTEFLGGPESPEKLADRQRKYAALGSGMYKIVDDESGVDIGSVGFWDKDWRGGEVYETGWMVLPAFQGRGLAVVATRQAIELARQTGRHRYMHAFPKVVNEASNAICRKLGFTLLGVCDFEYPPGNPIRCNDWQLDLLGSD
ncbi:MAG TPA: GNAT family N-acetyltransferase [Thermoleophilaceae bacterium]|nr:GNAT family N-acetyltransferase [Thermoleophilaceae bacterium]